MRNKPLLFVLAIGTALYVMPTDRQTPQCSPANVIPSAPNGSPVAVEEVKKSETVLLQDKPDLIRF